MERARAVARILTWGSSKLRGRGQARPERQTAEEGFLRRGSQPPPNQLGGLGERCKLP